MNLNGKVAMVTAGGAGIGRAIVERFVELGASVCLCDVDEDALAEARRALPQALVEPADVSSSHDVDRLFKSFARRHDRLDILVNNAGISGPTKPIDEITDAEWNTTLGVNVSGMFYTTRAATPFFRRQSSGAIINVSSVAGRLGMPLRAPYSTSKYAVRGLTEVLAVELGEIGVRVNAILPGLVDSPRGARVVRERAERLGMSLDAYMPHLLHNISMHTQVSMREIADMAAFLASDLAPHISGQSISVCGNVESFRTTPLPVSRETAGPAMQGSESHSPGGSP